MDNVTPEQRSKTMRQVRSKGTTPERKVFAELKRRKIYFAPHADKIVGKPDLVFRRKKVAVFIDSDFWHGHPERHRAPQSNQAYWQAKIARNRQRDLDVTAALQAQGWNVLRLWEYDVNHSFADCIAAILRAIGRGETTDKEGVAGG